MITFLGAVHARSMVYRALRDLLHAGGFHEVATPVLSPYPDIAPTLQFQTEHPEMGGVSCLRIAPTEFLKRLLEGGADRVYEFSTNFRPDVVDSTHLPEFTSLEVMLCEASVSDMQTLAERLIEAAANAVRPGDGSFTYSPPHAHRAYEITPPWPRISLPTLFADRYGFTRDDFFDVGRVSELYEAIVGCGRPVELSAAMDEMVTVIAQNAATPVFVSDFPQYLGGPAHPTAGDPRFKERSELFVGPLELANMSSTLTDAIELRTWHERTLALKARLGIQPNELDQPLLAAVERGLPRSAVVGIGIDRLLMILCGVTNISEIRPFAYGTLHGSVPE
jgi:lysyl-tRNA synthetase class II